MKKITKIVGISILLLLALSSPLFAGWIGEFEFEHYDQQGNLIWQDVSQNNLADEGEYAFLDVVLRAGTAPTTFYIGLSDTTTPCSIVDTDTLTQASAGEPSSGGYARQEVPRTTGGWPTLALDAGDYQATSTEETFTATTGFGPVCCAFLATTIDNTGKHIAYAGLSACRTLAASETLKVTYKVKLQ